VATGDPKIGPNEQWSWNDATGFEENGGTMLTDEPPTLENPFPAKYTYKNTCTVSDSWAQQQKDVWVQGKLQQQYPDQFQQQYTGNFNSNPMIQAGQAACRKLAKVLRTFVYYGKISKLLSVEYIEEIYCMFPDLDTWSEKEFKVNEVEYFLQGIIDVLLEVSQHMGMDNLYFSGVTGPPDIKVGSSCEDIDNIFSGNIFEENSSVKKDETPEKSRFDLLDIE